MDHHHQVAAADSTVRSQDSNNSSDSKESKASKMTDSTRTSSKPESCLESKHSKDGLIETGRRQQHQKPRQQQPQPPQEPKDDSNVLMFTSCGQLLLGVVLVVFGVLVLVHGAALSGSGAGLWAGAGALVAGALGVVATLATSSSGRTTSGFSSAHLASSLVALALSNMAAITALTAVVRDSQRAAPDVTQLTLPDDESIEVEEGWAGLLASIGLLVASVAELFVSGYTCVTLAPKLCGCLRPSDDQADDEDVTVTTTVDGKTLKTRNMVHQWVIAQNHPVACGKNQPIYVVQPLVPMHPMMQPPYGMPTPHGKFAGGFLPAPSAAYGAVPMLPAHMAAAAYPARPPSQIARGKQQQQKKRRHSSEHSDSGGEARQRRSSSQQQQSANKPMASIGEDSQLQQDLARTYTGLDKRISEEFISIAMDPERKSKASSHHGSEIGANK
ncbi:hypothetical protein TSAR_007885 [Trichomalopsis sarcophagae]|uniref:Transmembrane protein n=1 Tax=Trichomalopsis sarcophagae TaxID=543379 RepID=A0A232F715_9HYME|nr:hypothetical protein TSAR_007885 [Trichomalopsis sarcophagae]